MTRVQHFAKTMRARVEHGATSGAVIIASAAPISTSVGVTRIAVQSVSSRVRRFFYPDIPVYDNHQPGNKHRQQDKQHHAVKTEPTPPNTTSPICISHIGTMHRER